MSFQALKWVLSQCGPQQPGELPDSTDAQGTSWGARGRGGPEAGTRGLCDCPCGQGEQRPVTEQEKPHWPRAVMPSMNLLWQGIHANLLPFKKQNQTPGWVPEAHACNPSFLGSWDRENGGSRPALANSSQDPISKIIRTKWTRDVS
jgi:hypothetical protein